MSLIDKLRNSKFLRTVALAGSLSYLTSCGSSSESSDGSGDGNNLPARLKVELVCGPVDQAVCDSPARDPPAGFITHYYADNITELNGTGVTLTSRIVGSTCGGGEVRENILKSIQPKSSINIPDEWDSNCSSERFMVTYNGTDDYGNSVSISHTLSYNR